MSTNYLWLYYIRLIIMKYRRYTGESNIEKAVQEYLSGTASSFEIAKKYNMQRSRTYLWAWMKKHGKREMNGGPAQYGGAPEHKASPQPADATLSKNDETSAKSDKVSMPSKANSEHAARPPLGYLAELEDKLKTKAIVLDAECIDMMKFLDETHNEKIVQK
jgi:transposase-like protein